MLVAVHSVSNRVYRKIHLSKLTSKNSMQINIRNHTQSLHCLNDCDVIIIIMSAILDNGDIFFRKIFIKCFRIGFNFYGESLLQ